MEFDYAAGTAPARLSSENGRQYAFRVLHDGIMGLVFEPGEQLSESGLSDMLQISRTPIREAILTLQEWRLVEVLPQRSSCVSRIDLGQVEEGVFLRQVMEAAILREAVRRADDADLTAMRENLGLQRMRLEEGRWRECVEADNEFHRLLYLAAGRPRIWSSVNVVTAQLNRLRYLQNRVDVSGFSVGLEDHVHFYNVLERREDIDFDAAARQHVAAGYRNAFPRLKAEYPAFFT